MNTKTNPIVGIFCSDIHLSENPPVARRAEKNWWAAMRRPLDEIAALAKKHDCQIFAAGDIFDRWDAKPAVIVFALENLPWRIAAIPGNHDTPYHQPALLGQSAYWACVTAKRIFNLDTPHYDCGPFQLRAFPFGSEVQTARFRKPTVAVLHDYCWQNNYGSFPGVSNSKHARNWRIRLAGYTAAFFGDNHVGFYVHGVPQIFNCGTLMRRRADEMKYRPRVGLLRADGQIQTHYLDCRADKFADDAEKIVEAEAATGLDLTGFAEELRGLAAAGLDFREILLRRVGDNCIDGVVRKLILRAAGL